ncbi:MAG: tyrosine-protein phosphatase [Bacteroidales bacterium]
MFRYFPFIFFFLFLYSCATHTYDIQTVCEVTDVYNYVVKWEMTPHVDGIVDIYSSQDPDKFDMSRPVARESISKGRADILMKGSLNRCYFLLCFPDDVQTVVGVRAQKFNTVENFRDMGGYQNILKQSLKWGKLYRSGNFDSINDINARRIAKMKVKTFIDLRNVSQASSPSKVTCIPNYCHLPVQTQRPDPLPLVYKSQFKRGDAIVYMQDANREMLIENTESFRKMFEILLDESNYPVILSCRYGNMQSSLAAALILSALEMSDSVILDDYLLSNKYFNMRKVASEAVRYPLEIQDAITSMMISDERYLNAALIMVRKRYGSIAKYLEVELGIGEKEREKLKRNLLQ